MERELPPLCAMILLSHALPARSLRRFAALPALVLGLVLPSLVTSRPAQAQTVKPHAKATTPKRKLARRRSSPRVAAVDRARPAAREAIAPTAAALATSLNEMVDKVRDGTWGGIVVSLSRGDTIWSTSPDEKLMPASTMKLFTSALSLDKFGPEHHFTTDVLREGPVGPDGTLKGNLILRGGGDPAFSNKFLRGADYGAPIDSLARQIASAGIKRVTGDIVGDASAFDSKTIPDGWRTRYLGAGYAARVSALSLNDNLVWVAVTPGAAGQAATVALEPSSSGIPIIGSVRTTSGGGARFGAHKTADGSISVSGSIGAREGTRRYGLVVDDPALFTTGALRDALIKAGVQVQGSAKLGLATPTMTKVASWSSPSLERLISAMNRESINHYAELLFRDAAHAGNPALPGSAESGNAVLNQFLTTKVGAPAGAVDASDGSGLSTLDRVTARAMVDLLSYANRAPWRSSFHASLPVAGESELLRNRMKWTPAMGNLHAKTGTTNDVIGLSGYVTADNGEILAFAFIYNGRDRWVAKAAIDTMGAMMAGWGRK